MAVVDIQKHINFCNDHNMQGYVGSAKTGDQINQIFYRVAADLAGVKVTKAQVDSQQNYIAASDNAKTSMQAKQTK